ncbi:hypothetical protein ACFE04_024702 [Oxalis oulophora]
MKPAAVLPSHVIAVVKHHKDPIKALQIFNSVKNEQGFHHTLSTYTCMLHKLGFHGHFDAMEKLLLEMITIVDNTLLEPVYIRAMRNYGRKGKVQEAVDVFERMHFYNCQPTILSYNTLMNILVEYRYFDQAHKLYLRMKDKRRILPDVYTFTIRIKSFCKTKRPHAALRLLRNMPLQGCELNAVAYCTLIGGFYEENFHSEAYGLFDEMIRSGICPDVTTFNKLIHILCKKGHVQESEKLFNKVVKMGVSPNLYTVNIFIQGLCRKGALDEGIRLLDTATRENLRPDIVTYNTLICGLCKNYKVVEAESYLHKMVNEGLTPDGFTYNTIIDGFCKLGMIQNADRILSDANFKGFVADEFTYCSLINGLCEEGDINHAMDIFTEALGKGIKPSVILCNTLVKGLSRQGLILEALQVMNAMSDKGCSPDIWTYNIVINGLCKMGCVSDANTLVNDMISKGYLPDIFTFNTLIDGYCKLLKIENALELINVMFSHGVIPDVITYNSMLNGLCKAGKFEDVMETFKMMIENNCEPNLITYNITMESLCKARKLNEAVDLLEEISNKGLSLDSVCLGTLINGFSNNGDLDGAHKLFQKMQQKYNVSHTTATYNIMINAFCEKLNIQMAEKLFRDVACVPDSYTYRIMIEGFCQTGKIDSSYNFLLEAINIGFVPSLTTFGRVINCLCVEDRVHEAVNIIHLMVNKGVVPDIVNTIFEVDKREVAAPKIVVEDLLKKNNITYYAYELLYDGIRDKTRIEILLQKVRGPDGLKVVHIAAGAKHSALMTDKEAIMTWGWGEHGQLRLGDTNDQLNPQPVVLGREVLNKESKLNIYCGSGFTYAIR